MKCIRIVWGHPSPGPETHTKGNGPVTNTFCINTTPMCMAPNLQQYCIINANSKGLRHFSKWLRRSYSPILLQKSSFWMPEIGMFCICIYVLCICVFCISIRVIVQIVPCPVHPLNRAAGNLRIPGGRSTWGLHQFFPSSRIPRTFFLAFFFFFILWSWSLVRSWGALSNGFMYYTVICKR